MTGPGRSTLTAFERLDDAPDRLPQPHFDCPSLLPPLSSFSINMIALTILNTPRR